MPETKTVNKKSPAVKLKAVGKEVAPGVFEVAPGSILGKRLTMPGDDQPGWICCIGYYDKGGSCVGIYIDKPDKKKA